MHLHDLEKYIAIDIAEALEERFMDSEELYVRFLRKLAASNDLAVVEDFVAQQNWPEALRKAHNLKSSGFVSLPVDQSAHRIHTQSVKMKYTEPVVCRVLKKTADFSPGMHKIAASPFTLSHCRIRIFIETGTVKFL